MYWPDGRIGAWGYVLMTLNMVLFWGLVVAGVVLLVRYLGRGAGAGPAGPTGPTGPAGPTGPGGAERILAERYARGEIDEHEYQQRLSVLRGGR